jgi:hypothetical protein
MVQHFEVMLRHAESFCLEFCNFFSLSYLLNLLLNSVRGVGGSVLSKDSCSIALVSIYECIRRHNPEDEHRHPYTHFI